MDRKYLQGYADLTDINDLELPKKVELALGDFMGERETDSFLEGLLEYLADDKGVNVKGCTISIVVDNIEWDKEEE